MVPMWVMTAALAAGAYEPVPLTPPAAEVHRVPGPAFLIPCKVDGAEAVARVQLWVSADRGRSWELYEEIAPDKEAFTFLAKKPGEYWFAPRLKKKDGGLLPAAAADLVPVQRVAVANGTGPEPIAKPSAADTADDLDNELNRVELELIRTELKRLSEAKEFTPAAEEMIDRLRSRLRFLRERLRPAPPPETTLSPLPTVAGEGRYPVVGPPVVQTLIPAPGLPVAPLPRAPGPR